MRGRMTRQTIAFLLMGAGASGGLIALVMTANRTLRPAAEFNPLFPALVLLGFGAMVLGAGLRSRASAQAALAAALCILGIGLTVAGLWADLPIQRYLLSATMVSGLRAVAIVVGLICLVGGIIEFIKSPLPKVLPRLRR